jgi:hypothetical protein
VLTSAVIDVVLAVILTFALTALAASAVVEWIGNLLKKRAKYLLRGLRNMLDATDVPPPPHSPEAEAPSGAAEATAAASPRATEAKAEVPADATAGPRSERAIYDQALDPSKIEVQDLGRPPSTVDGSLTGLLFDHPLLRSMMQPQQSMTAKRTRVPPYIAAETFSRALVDTLIPADPTATGHDIDLDRIRAGIERLNDAMPAKQALLALVDQAQNDVDKFMTSLEKWYDAQMDRVSGWYKRWAKRVIIGVAAVICLLGNVDGYAIARSLYADPVSRSAVVSEVQQGQACNAQGRSPEEQITCVRNLAGTHLVLWPSGCPRSMSACVAQPGQGPPGVTDWLIKLLGLALTIAAASIGAPFWFDTLNRLVNLRNTGKVPATTT